MVIGGLPLQVQLNAQSIWAIVSGNERTLTIFEDNLRVAISQGLSNCGGVGMQPWFRRNGAVHILAGLLVWAHPDAVYPTVWEGDTEDFDARMHDLEEMGWRDYQLNAVSAAIRAPLGRGILDIGTGGGKSRVAWGIAYVARGSWLHIVHGRDLVRQANADFFDLSRALRMEQKLGWKIVSYGWHGAPVQNQETAGLLIDECFPAGTQVDGRAIEALKVGDFVTAYDERTGKCASRKVLKTYRNKPNSLVTVSIGAKHIHCTYRHPFLTKDGLRSAGALTSCDSVLSKTGQKEGCVSSWIGVGGVETHEQTSDGTFGGLCPDGFVYNIEVAEHHTYFVNDIVVHNCHSVAAATRAQVVAAFRGGWRIGLSGTPLDRTDERNTITIGLLGPQVATVDVGSLTDAGHLTPGVVRLIDL